jgi:hypothetical protein
MADWEHIVWSLAEARDYSVLWSTQTSSGAQPAYSVNTRGCFPGGKAAIVWVSVKVKNACISIPQLPQRPSWHCVELNTGTACIQRSLQKWTLYSDFIVHIAHRYQTEYIRPPCTHHWDLNICATAMLPSFVSQCRRYQCQVSVARREQLLHIGIFYKPLAIHVLLKGSKDMQITGHKIRAVGSVALNVPAVAP